MHHTAQSHRGDVVEVFPGTFETVDMYTDNPGTWLLHCHVMTHLVDGMEAKYAILHKGGTVTFFIYIKHIALCSNRLQCKNTDSNGPSYNKSS